MSGRWNSSGDEGPGSPAEAAFAPPSGDEFAVHDLEVESEAGGHLLAPLQADGGGTDDEHHVEALTQAQLLDDQGGFDGLAEPDVVGDEEVGAGQLEGLLQGCELVVEEVDAGAGSSEVVDSVSAAGGLELVASEGAQELAEVDASGVEQGPDELAADTPVVDVDLVVLNVVDELVALELVEDLALGRPSAVDDSADA